jgi:hypothetical protein
MATDEVTRRVLATYESGEMLTMCAWCKRLELESDWVFAPRAALAAIDSRYVLSHSICPPCAERGFPLGD